MKKKQEETDRNLRILNSIIRLPLMCDQFQKAIRRRTETHRAKRAEKEGIKILSEEGINQDTQSQYFDRFIDKVDKDLF